MNKIFTIDIADIDDALLNFSIDNTILGLFAGIHPLFPDVEIARDIVAGIINAYMSDIDITPNLVTINADNKITVYSRN